MNTSNINDLSLLIEQKEHQHFTFRQLELQDVPQLLSLMIYQFLNYDPAFQIAQLDEQDIKSCFTQELFNWIIQGQLSYGAFKNDILISACLTYDLMNNDNTLDIQEILITQKMQDILKMNDILLDKYVHKKNFKQKEIAYVSHLATKTDYFHQELALSCFFLSVQECSRQGFQQVITVAEHVGTFKTFQKIFKKSEIIKEINEFKGKPITINSLIGSIVSNDNQ